MSRHPLDVRKLAADLREILRLMKNLERRKAVVPDEIVEWLWRECKTTGWANV